MLYKWGGRQSQPREPAPEADRSRGDAIAARGVVRSQPAARLGSNLGCPKRVLVAAVLRRAPVCTVPCHKAALFGKGQAWSGGSEDEVDMDGDEGGGGLSCLARSGPCANKWLYLRTSSGRSRFIFVEDLSLSVVLFLLEHFPPFLPSLSPFPSLSPSLLRQKISPSVPGLKLKF